MKARRARRRAGGAHTDRGTRIGDAGGRVGERALALDQALRQVVRHRVGDLGDVTDSASTLRP